MKYRDLFEQALLYLAPQYGVQINACAHYAEVAEHSDLYARALKDGHFVLDKSRWPKECLERMSAGALMGRAILLSINESIGRNLFATALKQMNAVHAGALVHAQHCAQQHDTPSLDTLAERLSRLLSQKSHHETSRINKTWPHIDEPMYAKCTIVEDALRQMSYGIGTEVGLLLAMDKKSFFYAHKRPSVALDEMRVMVATHKPLPKDPITTRIFKYLRQKLTAK